MEYSNTQISLMAKGKLEMNGRNRCHDWNYVRLVQETKTHGAMHVKKSSSKSALEPRYCYPLRRCA